MLLGGYSYAQTSTENLLNQLNETSDIEDQIDIYVRLSYDTDDVKLCLEYSKKAFQLLDESHPDALRARVYQMLGRDYANNQMPDSARSFLQSSLKIFQSLSDSKGTSKTWYYLAFYYELKHEFDSAVTCYEQAISIASAAGDESNYALYNLFLGDLQNIRGENKEALKYLNLANEYFDSPERGDSAWFSLNSLAIVHDEIGLYPQALEYYLKAYDIVERLDDKEAKLILANNLGTIYHELGKIEKSKDFYAQGLEMARANSMPLDEAMILNNLSIVYTEEGDTLGALKLLRRAHAIQVKEKPSCDLAYSFEGLGEVMAWQRKYDSAWYYYNEAMEWANKCEMIGSQTSIYRNMGLLALKLGNDREGVDLLEKSLNLGEKSNYAAEIKETLKEMFEYYNSINDVKNALKYHLLFTSINDSLYNAQMSEKIARMTAEYDFRREMESLEYKKMADEMRLNEELRQKESFQNSILVVLVLTTLLAATLGRSYYLLQNHNKKLTALNEEKNTLMGVVAHDLRSPLNNIKGLISLVKMEKSSLTPEQSHYFHLVDDTMERMRDMIDRVLDISVVEDMKVNLNLKKVDLGQTMNFVAGNFELLASKKSIKIHSDLDTQKHFVFADYNYLLQVIENLISNAIKFSESGKNIFMNVFQEDNYETMIVRDEGPGISEEDQKKLFNKFQKLSAKPTDNEQSTGLGLSIVKKFIDAMDAEISCESQVGVGTSFIIKFKTAVEKELV